jgi:hypothetical protein
MNISCSINLYIVLTTDTKQILEHTSNRMIVDTHAIEHCWLNEVHTRYVHVTHDYSESKALQLRNNSTTIIK